MNRQDMEIHATSAREQQGPWVPWLIEQIKQMGYSRFEAAHETDADALRNAKIRFEVAEEVKLLIDASAKIYNDARSGPPQP